MFKRSLIWFGLALGMWQAVSARCASFSELPFKLRAGLIWVQVEPSSGGKSLQFILDSGAEASVMDLQTARNLHLEMGEPVTVRGINSTALGFWTQSSPARMAGVELPTNFLAMDLSALSAACHRQVDGLIGADFFAGRIVQIDFTRGKVRVLAKSNPRMKDEVLPLQIDALRLRVPVEVVGLGKAWARLDTGCASSLHWAVSTNVLEAQASSQELGVGVTTIRIQQNNQSVRLGGLKLDKVPTGLHTEKLLAGEDGLLGAGLLTHFAIVTIDEPGGQLILEEYSNPKPHSRR
jgi:Aspartyl protease